MVLAPQQFVDSRREYHTVSSEDYIIMLDIHSHYVVFV